MHNAGIFCSPMNIASDPRSSVTGVVLAGGRGLRMGGVDKGLIEIDGRTLVEHQIDALRPQVSTLIVSANRNLDRYRALGAAVVTDLQAGFPGPLAGMAAAARAACTEWIVCVPCDTRALPAGLVARLVDAALQTGVDAACAADRDGPQYVVCALRTSLADALAQAAASERRAVRDLLQAQRAVTVRFDDWRCTNLNTPEALAC
jgi:molybdenum cofactor guanylyltransferase